jgi:hypothetical protein
MHKSRFFFIRVHPRSSAANRFWGKQRYNYRKQAQKLLIEKQPDPAF